MAVNENVAGIILVCFWARQEAFSLPVKGIMKIVIRSLQPRHTLKSGVSQS